MSAIDLIALLVALPPMLLLIIFTAEIMAGLRAFSEVQDDGTTPSTTVLIPAHNEAAGIVATIHALREQAPPAISILVVADNCTDDTAIFANLAGATVVERVDPSLRGKGYALAFGREALAKSAPPSCIVVIDADCVVEGRGVAALARTAMATGRAVQARNLQRSDLAAPPTAQISNFAFLVKNLVRQRGMLRLGGVAALTGTGMAIPWDQFAAAPLASAELAEDLALGVWLTRNGKPPRINESVHVWSDAASGSALLVQRSRWERGFLATARQQAMPLIGRGLRHGSRSQIWLGLHLIVPPLALLFAGTGAALMTAVLLTLVGASSVPAIMLAAVLAAAGMATMLAWAAEGRGRVSGRALLATPFYIASKLPLYRALLGNRGNNGWVRTRRAGESDLPR